VTEQQHSQGLTRREVIKKGALLGGTVMWVTPIVQTVGMSRALAQEPSDNCIPDNWAVEVVLNQQGVKYDGNPILPDRSNPAHLIGNDDNFFSLGFRKDGDTFLSPPGGQVRVRLAQPAYKHTGSNVLVVEATGGDYPLEKAAVYVSSTNSQGVLAGYATNKAPAVNLGGTPAKFQTVLPFPDEVDVVEYVTLIDVTDPADFAALSTADRNAADGFDVVRVGTGCGSVD
jgi:hypothetical protein